MEPGWAEDARETRERMWSQEQRVASARRITGSKPVGEGRLMSHLDGLVAESEAVNAAANVILQVLDANNAASPAFLAVDFVVRSEADGGR